MKERIKQASSEQRIRWALMTLVAVALLVLCYVFLVPAICSINDYDIPAEVIDKIYALDDLPPNSESIAVWVVEEDEELIRVYLDLKFVPVDDEETREWTDRIAHDVVGIFNMHDIEMDVSVWAIKYVDGEESQSYGSTVYASGVYSFQAID